MEEKKRLNQDDPEQSARFIEAAEQIETEETKGQFEEAMRLMVKVKRANTEEEPSSCGG